MANRNGNNNIPSNQKTHIPDLGIMAIAISIALGISIAIADAAI